MDDKTLLSNALGRNDREQALPHEVVIKLIKEENPIYVLRHYREKFMNQLA